MLYWLLKSEPSTYSWDDMVRDEITVWDGVRNYQARNNMVAMSKGDLCFFYHSGITEPVIMGIAQVCETYIPDPLDSTFGSVKVQYKSPLSRPVTLAQIKSTPILASIPLIRQSRLSVMPISNDEWTRLLSMGETTID